jgi:integrase
VRIDKRVRKRRDGSTYVRFMADAGRDRSDKKQRKEFATRREAQAFLDETRSRRNDGPRTEITIRELGMRYVKDRKDVGRESSTYKKYEEHFKNHICAMPLSDGELKGSTLGDCLLRDLDTRHFKQFMQDLIRSLSNSMMKKVRSTLRQALDYAVEKQWAPANLLRSIRVERVSSSSDSDVEIPTEKQLGEILGKIVWEEGGPVCFAQAYVLTAVGTGLRPGEQRALRWANTHIDKRPYYVEVVEAVGEDGRRKGPKTMAGNRIVPIGQSLALLLRAWQNFCPGSTGDLVFPTQAGHFFSHSNLDSRVWKRLQIGAGVYVERRDKKGKVRKRGIYRLYALRHTYASIQIEIGVKPEVLAKRMGHESAAFTMKTYVKLWEKKELDQADAEKMEKWIDDLPREA